MALQRAVSREVFVEEGIDLGVGGLRRPLLQDVHECCTAVDELQALVVGAEVYAAHPDLSRVVATYVALELRREGAEAFDVHGSPLGQQLGQRVYLSDI